MLVCILTNHNRQIGMKPGEILDIENFIKGKEIAKSLRHFYSLYELITTQFPNYRLPICNFTIR